MGQLFNVGGASKQALHVETKDSRTQDIVNLGIAKTNKKPGK